MLLGREAMIGQLLIDCEATFLAGNITDEQLELFYCVARQTQV